MPYNLTCRQKQCLNALNDLGGKATANQIALYLFENGLVPYFSRNFSHPRLTELTKQGLLVENGKSFDMLTHRKVTIYEEKERFNENSYCW